MTIDAIVEWAGSTSGWVNARPRSSARSRSEIRRLGEGSRGEVSIADVRAIAARYGERFPLPKLTYVFAFERL